jgi:hypothetical protein
MAFDFDVVVATPEGEEVELNRGTFTGDLRQTELVSAPDVNVSDRVLRDMLHTYATPDELQEALERLSNLTESDIDTITEKFDIKRLVDNAENVMIYSDVSEYFDENYADMFDGVDSSLMDLIMKHLDVTEFTRDYLKDQEYLLESGDGAILDVSMLG